MPGANLTAEGFVEKWSRSELSERAASHEHFLDLCRLLDQPTPATADSTGADYTLENQVKMVGVASKGSVDAAPGLREAGCAALRVN